VVETTSRRIAEDAEVKEKPEFEMPESESESVCNLSRNQRRNHRRQEESKVGMRVGFNAELLRRCGSVVPGDSNDSIPTQGSHGFGSV
jgi:transcription elongation GreA/GreB family factor